VTIDTVYSNSTSANDVAPRICFVCGGIFHPSGHLPGLLKCGQCGFISACLDLSASELERIYGTDYFHGGEYRDYVEEGPSLRFNFRRRLQTMRKVVPNVLQRDLLEIGCAYGFFLDEARPFVRSATGIDIVADGIAHARQTLGVDARQGDYLTAEFAHKFGAIAMWDTIEHLSRPDLFVAKAHSDLDDGGIIAITTGDIGSLNARWRGRRWRMIHPPTHLHYFSATTIGALLSRHGFEVVHLSHPGNSRNLRSMLHGILALRLDRQRLYEAIAGWPLLDLQVSINLADIMFVIARRKTLR
jgi:2-polyprenyl-3-methyl-5-hydroxy-6-metoxy-1,4-benzoquinol methylase